MGYPMDSQPKKTTVGVRVQKFFWALRKFWWVPLLTLVICIGACLIQFMNTPPMFASYARLWETEKFNLPGGAAFIDDPDTYFGTLKEVLRSDSLKHNALQLMRLASPNVPTTDLEGKEFDVQINVVQANKSAVFLVEADSPNPAFTPAYLNALMAAYREYKRTIRKEVSGDTLASIAGQVKRLEGDLKASQDALAEAEMTNNYVVLQQENQIAGDYLARLKTQLADCQLQIRLLEAVGQKKTDYSKGGTNDVVSLVASLHESSIGSPAPTESDLAQREIQMLKLQRERLSKYLRPAHPRIVKLDEDIAHSQHLLETYHQQTEQQLASDRQAYQLRIAGLNNSIKEWEDKVSKDNVLIAGIGRLRMKVARDQAYYDRLSELLQTVDISRNIDQETLEVLEPASTATRSWKSFKTNLLQSAFGGLGLGLGLIFLISLRDDRITSLVEVSENISDNVVGQVPDIRRLKSKSPLMILEKNDDRHMYIESFRSLRSALFYLSKEPEPPKLILITSGVPNEGKSTISANLARVLALGGSRVLLVDGDLRKGHLHDLMGLRAKPGLTELLLRPDEFDRIVQTNSFENLSFIACGTLTQNSAELFLGSAFNDLLARVREQYDYVIIDSSPVFATDDAATIAPKVDGTLFVVRSHFSRSGMIKAALEMLYRRQAKVLGLVINRVDSANRSYYYYKYDSYYSPAADTPAQE